MTVWIYRTADRRPHWSSTEWIAFSPGNYQITQVTTEEQAEKMRQVFPLMTVDEWCNMRTRAGLPMYPPKKRDERDTRYADAVDDFLVRSVEAR